MLTHKPWSAESVFRLLIVLLVGWAGMQMVVGGADRIWADVPEETRRFWVMMGCTTAIQVFSITLVAVFLRKNRLTWREAFGLPSARPGRDAVIGLGATLGVFVVAMGLIVLSQYLIELLHMTPRVQTVVRELQGTNDPLRQTMVAVSAVLFAPLFEELLYRGILYPAVKQAGFPRVAFWGTAVFFAASHQNLLTFAPLLLYGVVLNVLYERTNSLFAPIVSHTLFNLGNFVWIVLGGRQV